MHSKNLIFLFCFIAFIISFQELVNAQDTLKKKDSTKIKSDTIISKSDSSKIKNDSLKSKNDTLNKKKSNESENALASKVEYKSRDSIRFDIEEQKVYLYGKAEIKYEDITLTADYIEISFKKNLVYAKGVPDSIGRIVGTPVFTQGTESFTSSTMTYNFKTKKGMISDIITKAGDSYLHGKIVKKFVDNSINVKNGMYTTCEDVHPHYEIKFSRARVIPDDKIVSGPAYLVIEDVPTPIAVPFGFFPNKKGQRSGILIPSYGESANRGFYLENGGYYFGMGEHMDMQLRGDVYAYGSWAARAISDYIMRYKYKGNFSFGYAVNIDGEKGVPGYQRNKDFFIKWTHTEDPKAHPNSRFSASVNAASTGYSRYNPASTQDFLSNTLVSSISYSTNIADKFNFSANLNHNQDLLTHTIDLNLPEIAFSVNRFYPFRRENSTGKPKWYENISAEYDMNAENTINTYDSLLFRKETLKQMQNGMKHNIPISWSGKVLKNFTWTNSANYTERWYLNSIRKYWQRDTTSMFLKTDTVNGFRSERDFNFSSSLSTRIYGMYQFKHGSIIAIRHVMTPSVSFVYTPNFGSSQWGYYRYINEPINNNIKTIPYYTIYQNGIYGSPPSAKSGVVNFSLANNLEMKVRNKKDTTTGTKKIVLIDNFTISGGYDIAADSLNWQKITMSGRTKLFKNIDLTYSSLWDPYAMNDSTGNDINRFEWKTNKRLLRLDNSTWALNLNWNLHSKEKKKEITSTKATEDELNQIKANPDKYVDFNQKWNLTFIYTLTYSSIYDQTKLGMSKKVIQTLSFTGDINIATKWKVGFMSGYDFIENKMSYTSINIYRDLHCWEMILNWIPTGIQKSYNLTIRVKSPVLQDLKLTKKKDFRDT